MKTYKDKGIYGEGNVYVIENLDDFNEYEKFLGDECIRDSNPNFYAFKNDFEKCIGKIWTNKNSEYKVIAIEDNGPWMDWYWVVQNVDDDRDIKYLLANDNDFQNNLK